MTLLCRPPFQAKSQQWALCHLWAYRHWGHLPVPARNQYALSLPPFLNLHRLPVVQHHRQQVPVDRYQVCFVWFVNILRSVAFYSTRTIFILLFHQSDINSCLNPNGLGLWHADHSNSKCVRDCEEGNGVTRGGLANGDRNYSDPKSCCESELQWRLPKFCEVSHQEVVEKCIDSTMTCWFYILHNFYRPSHS